MTEHPMTVDDGGGRRERKIVDYPSNSKKLQEVKTETKEKIEKVVTGNVVRRRRSLAARMFGDMVAEDSMSVFEYLLADVLVPAFRNLIVDFVTQGVERAVYGESKSRSTSGRPAYTSYSSRFGTGRPTTERERQQPALSRQARSQHDFSDVILAERRDAEEVLDGLRELIERFDVATVSDFYELIGITSEFTDNKHGWTDLRDARVVATRGGWLFRMPRTQPMTT
jgi:hypothetical protein